MSKELIKLLRAEIARTVDLDMMHHNAANRIEELEAELRTRDNAEATHRITLREVQAETMRVQTKYDALLADNERLREALQYMHNEKVDYMLPKARYALAKVRKP